MTIDSIITEREKTHGDYKEVARTAQQIKDIMRSGSGWNSINIECKESLELIATKIARIVNSGCGKNESMIDISGYAELARRSFEREVEGKFDG